MKLFAAEKIAADKRASHQKQIDRIRKLNEAETKAANNFNATRDRIEKEEKLLKKNLRELEDLCKTRKAELLEEVSSLENRRRDALKPIKEIRKEADDMLAEAKDEIAAIDEAKIVLREERETLTERIESVSDRESSVDEKEDDLSLREQKISSAEKVLESSSKKLSEKWAAFHTEVNSANKDLDRREKELTDSQRANELFKESLDAKLKEIADGRKAIKDGYETLAKAREEILGRST